MTHWPERLAAGQPHGTFELQSTTPRLVERIMPAMQRRQAMNATRATGEGR